jgi:hypothetical protein
MVRRSRLLWSRTDIVLGLTSRQYHKKVFIFVFSIRHQTNDGIELIRL